MDVPRNTTTDCDEDYADHQRTEEEQEETNATHNTMPWYASKSPFPY